MFDMQHVSRTISTQRKARNMTQMELADRLNISFQAVSNWERGQTMPDISKLGELADIFGVTIDELLGNGKSTDVVGKLLHDEPVEEDLSPEDFLDVAPLVKPRQAEKLFENIRGELSMKELIMTAPFISQEVLDALAIQAAKREKSFKRLIGLLPFLSKDAINQCLEYVTEDGLDVKKLIAAAPFIGRDNVDKLADRVIVEGSLKELIALAPFMRKKKLTAIAFQFADKQGFTGILPLLPFIDKEELDVFFRSKWKDQGMQDDSDD